MGLAVSSPETPDFFQFEIKEEQKTEAHTDG
jgi:hypothetical protein